MRDCKKCDNQINALTYNLCPKCMGKRKIRLFIFACIISFLTGVSVTMKIVELNLER